MPVRRPAALLLLLSLGIAGCAPSGSDVTQACIDRAGLNEKTCTCVGGKADKELSEPAIAFLVATLNEDKDAVEAARAKLSLGEVVQAGLFMVTAGASCSLE